MCLTRPLRAEIRPHSFRQWSQYIFPHWREGFYCPTMFKLLRGNSPLNACMSGRNTKRLDVVELRLIDGLSVPCFRARVCVGEILVVENGPGHVGPVK